MSSRYEFLGSTAVGQYIPRESWFHQRDPRARLAVFVFLLTATIFSPNLWGLTLGFGTLLILYLLSILPIKPALDGIKRALPFILILVFLQILFASPAEGEFILWEWIGIQITEKLLTDAVVLIYRFVVLIFLINGLVMSISTSQITAALFHLLKPFENLGFPVNDLTMVIQITLRYIPLVAQSAEKIAKAQASRGGDWEQHGFNPIRQARRVLPLIIPIIINSLKQAETMAVAMESRGFNAAEKRSSYYQLAFLWQDGLLVLVMLLISAIILLSGKII
jgi:energy-coupling factor transport system permease protein